jgi:hypothetical protein
VPAIVGIDPSFSFPLRYFEVHHLLPEWPAFLDDFQRHWPTHEDHTYVDFIRDGMCGNGEARSGNARWRRITEERAKAKSVFHFDVPGSVAKSTHAGLPWLRYLRQRLGDHIHFWPFDGWEIPAGRSALVEVYPSLWSKSLPREGRTSDQHDAYVASSWTSLACLLAYWVLIGSDPNNRKGFGDGIDEHIAVPAGHPRHARQKLRHHFLLRKDR